MTRALDVILGGLALVVASPFLLVAALVVRLSSRGGALFRQTRVGLHGREFEILKLRTMRATGTGPAVTTTADPRITRFGAWLRSSKLDELPQLVNVLRGEMSLVGPRPEVPEYVCGWPPEVRDVVLSVRPGITDPASVEFRREAEILAAVPDPEDYYLAVVVPRKLEMYVEYVRARSLTGDLRVLARTALATIGR